MVNIEVKYDISSYRVISYIKFINLISDEEPSIEEEEHIMQLFELVNQKNALFRRQAELMYM